MNSRMRAVSGWAAALLLSALGWGPGASGQSIAAGQLDPARDPAALHSLHHAPLPEEYVWTAHDAAATLPNHAQFTFRDRERKTELHMFRGSFTLAQRPAVSTLYIAGPRSVKAFLNGTAVMEQAADAQSPLNTHVFRADVSAALRIGTNVLAIEAVRGRGIVAASDSPVVQQMAYGETLVAKIVPAAPGVEAASLSMTTAA